jgi:two-component system chemotaxis response regulator CheB
VKEILGNLPQDYPLPIVVAIHCNSRLSSSVAGWFDRECSLHVSDARDGELLPEDPGVVLTAPPGRNLRICRGRTVLDDATDNVGCAPSVDELFASAAEHIGDATIGVLLTGMGTDGAAGLKCVRDRGGCTIAQDEDSCVVFGMPAAAIKLGAVEHVTPLQEIPQLLTQLAGSSRRMGKPAGAHS